MSKQPSKPAAVANAMTLPEYIQFVDDALPAKKDWQPTSDMLRLRATELRKVDPTMVMIMQGLTVQIDRYFDLLAKRKAEFDRAKEIVARAEPIDSQPKLEDETIETKKEETTNE